MVAHDMRKVAAEHVASVMHTNLAEYLEKGIDKMMDKNAKSICGRTPWNGGFCHCP